jgi:hypothetical protein
VIPKDFITEWREQAPWITDAQVEQDLVISRALVEIFKVPELQASIGKWATLGRPCFRGWSRNCRALHGSGPDETAELCPRVRVGRGQTIRARERRRSRVIRQSGRGPPPPTENPTKIPDDSQCYELTVYGTSASTDQSPFMVPPGESYNCFYFDAPWTTPTESVAFKSKSTTRPRCTTGSCTRCRPTVRLARSNPTAHRSISTVRRCWRAGRREARTW